MSSDLPQSSPSARRLSTNSPTSTHSEHPQSVTRSTSSMQTRIGMSPRQTNVGTLSGTTDRGPDSPTVSTRSDSPFSPGAVDRVFPMRSVVSVDPTATPMPHGDGEVNFLGVKLEPERGLAARREINLKEPRPRSE